MISSQPITLFNTGLPVMLMALAAWWVPLFLARRTVSQQGLIKGILASALIVIVGGAGVFGVIYQANGIPVFSTLVDEPVQIMGYFGRLSFIAGIIWGPVLALSWFVLAQGVERRKGEDLARRGSA